MPSYLSSLASADAAALCTNASGERLFFALVCNGRGGGAGPISSVRCCAVRQLAAALAPNEHEIFYTPGSVSALAVLGSARMMALGFRSGRFELRRFSPDQTLERNRVIDGARLPDGGAVTALSFAGNLRLTIGTSRGVIYEFDLTRHFSGPVDQTVVMPERPVRALAFERDTLRALLG